MANGNNGVFQDLFNAVGEPVQNLSDAAGSGVSSILDLAQDGVKLCATLVTSTTETAVKVVQGVADGITSSLSQNR
ncbi:hypothetical protein INT08_08570 [Prosthecochloris sp. N3]|uniref:Chlorosome envelope protein B n=1 Tax=Prosthecochloris ethylica TaxID=2743976 RepID=A0ABR9XTM9_9CHLB|nr:hypothetical protein [Prosthecochloris ethylica]MBF0587080.1 hypothetical protein [Prosthecochloris ethylica]MBF0637222.1 hypothetical protein [Prosthecochloris ethylica]MEC9487737.1 hypothetical protein [Prosthecochloris sp.]NUK48233.1 hypothetical protein [Prosthecochloris ethylica]